MAGGFVANDRLVVALSRSLALAVVHHRGFRLVPEANPHFAMRRDEALDAILSLT